MAYIYPGGKADTAFADGNTSSGWAPQSYLYGADIVIPSSGTVTLLGFRGAADTGTIAFKIGLYTSGGVLVGQTTGSATTGAAWRDGSAVSLSVSAATYYVMVSAASSGMSYTYDTTGNGTFATEAYATAMQATETLTIGGDTNLHYGVRVDFTAGGGSATSRPIFPSFPMVLLNF